MIVTTAPTAEGRSRGAELKEETDGRREGVQNGCVNSIEKEVLLADGGMQPVWCQAFRYRLKDVKAWSRLCRV